MKPFLQCVYKPAWFVLLLLTLAGFKSYAQPATWGNPVSIGRNNCGSSGGTDSTFFFDYTSPSLVRANYPNAYKPLLKMGPTSTTNRFTISLSSIAFNPKDQKLYFLWTNGSGPGLRTYVWRWKADTTFSTSGSPTTAMFLDTLRSFPYDIGGVAFANDGMGWTLEFPPPPAARAFLRPIDFAGGSYGAADTLDFLPGPGNIGDTIFVPGNGDITLMPSGQMYFNFDNKLYTPDYQSYGDPTNHLKCTFIDSTKLPTGATALVGLAYSNGDLLSSYQNTGNCTYRRLDPLTGDTNYVSYNYAAGKGVRSVDMTQINAGVGASKKLYSLNLVTGNQYDVEYDVYVKNYGNIPVLNVQVKDSLGGINTNANVSNVSLTWVNNPAGLTLNGSYNGTTNVNLLTAGQTLPNYPEANNNFTIRVKVRLNGILQGVVYNNSAIATGTGWNARSLRDSSTNGNVPDLNQNDKPDDFGEGQPTPFIVTLVPSVPPCSSLSQVLYNQDFGSGAVGLYNSLPAVPTASTTYNGSSTAPLSVNRFAVTDSAQRGDATNWVKLRDHTGNATGRMMVVNADAPSNYFYRDTLASLCPRQQYSFSFYAAFLGNATYQTTCNAFGGFKFPKVKCRVRDATTGLVITEASTSTITLTSWTQYGIKWVMPSGYSNIIFELINDAPGGCGNDIAIDDIQFGICNTTPSVSISNSAAGCIGQATTFTATISDPSVLPGTNQYQFQWAPAIGGPWTTITTNTTGVYTIGSTGPSDVGRYYRVIVAANGNIGIPTCQYTSAGVLLTAKVSSVAAGSISRNKNNICAGISVNLGVVGGTLGTNAAWRWYTGSCGTTLVGSGTTLTVTPAVTTTYYVRAEGDCNSTACVQITVTINCDIDKDDDGIPDYVESNMAAARLDASPANGILDAFDPAYAGYKDNNNDFINDDFQADGDSDNDGIANYLDIDFPGRVDANTDGVDDRFDFDKDGKINMLDLDSDNDGVPDVVEAYGVDNNGDAKIDNYTDTDGDGFSQNVDGNGSGAYVSGLGLGWIDFDNDGLPNFLDLDSDNDGIPDLLEAGGPDTNNNGIVDGIFTDANGDGLHDSYINVGALLRTGTDGNSDGRADTYPNKNFDGNGKPNPYDVDSDGDGIVDVIESGLPDLNLNGVIDGAIGTNGWATIVSALPAINLRNTDAVGNPDYLDIDSDGDGIPDNIEGQTTAGYTFAVNTDTDGDGLDNSYDNLVGFAGSGIFVLDLDGDGTPDYRDLDTDADGQPDIKEGNDFNLNGLADDLTTPTGLDTDGDGLDNRFDSSNTSVEGTSYMMGNGGSLIGDATPGARCPVQKKTVGQLDRDWRFVGSTLPIQLLSFTGNLQANKVALNWQIITPVPINKFEIERSTTNGNFSKIGTVYGPVPMNIQQSYNFNDDVSNINSEVIFYRLRIIAADGQVKYSNVVLVRKNFNKTDVKLMPNPTSDHFMIMFYAQKETTVSLRMMDNTGRLVLKQESRAGAGQNSLQINNLEKLSNGVYLVQFYINDEVVTNKLVIQK